MARFAETPLKSAVDRSRRSRTVAHLSRTLGVPFASGAPGFARVFQTARNYWDLAARSGTADPEVVEAQREADVASKKALTMHETIRRLERLADEHQTVIRFRARRPTLAAIAVVVALSIGGFAAASNPPEPAVADLGGAELRQVDLSGASLRGADLSGMRIRGSDLSGTNLEGADITGTTWKNTTCPDGTNSDQADDTCDGHLDPIWRPDPLE